MLMTPLVPTVPVLALKVASRIAIYISKDSKTVWRSVICRGKCYTELEVPCVLPPPSFTSEQMVRVKQAGMIVGRVGFSPQTCGRKKHGWRELPRPQENHQCLELALKRFWHSEEMKNSRRKNRQMREMRAQEKKGGKQNGKEGDRQAAFHAFSLMVVAQEQTPSSFEMYYRMLWLFRCSLDSLINTNKQLKTCVPVMRLSTRWTLLWKALWGAPKNLHLVAHQYSSFPPFWHQSEPLWRLGTWDVTVQLRTLQLRCNHIAENFTAEVWK